ncbi:NAD(P)/FAD-dependent oxidoreductase [Ulvibacterium marinum]|uniref:Pyridine nucleotide-disulfide oxidoreductase n=1 Tax=Ulvibacterium marinum TaxID=2419782 RepID=A0A3B0C928_9FLAO|nr:FAD-dependent oxidoreductase [Ulvibacterium marinum]RKN80904.1 pyridine nucleotide-disulfide oxidoreductase [Ulvibacterium marinum]
MAESRFSNRICVVLGASHAGVNFAFSLRREGWDGEILLFDSDPELPYHRPPLSKTYLTNGDTIEKNLLKPEESYKKEGITLRLGTTVSTINKEAHTIILEDGDVQPYDKLVIATGARPIIPPIPGIDTSKNVFLIRSAKDIADIRSALKHSKSKRIVIIGGGYIGLEAAASLKKTGADVTVLEREERVLARVTAPEMSNFFKELHTENEVPILTAKDVKAIETQKGYNEVLCTDGSRYIADILILGCGIRVNQELAKEAGLDIENGIRVNSMARTNDKDIYAIGDCTFHYNPHYDRFIRLECVQNAVDQAKVAAAAICGKEPIYDTIPWFWSDQYDVKLQMVGLSEGYDRALVRKEVNRDNCFSIWYFKGDTLLAVDAVNNAKAYVYGTKFIKSGEKIDTSKLLDSSIEFKPSNLLAE